MLQIKAMGTRKARHIKKIFLFGREEKKETLAKGPSIVPYLRFITDLV